MQELSIDDCDSDDTETSGEEESAVSWITVVFKVEAEQVKPREIVFVTGSCSALGEWDVTKALPLSHSPKGGPLWEGTLPLPRSDLPVEYKYFTASASAFRTVSEAPMRCHVPGEDARWEIGSNRALLD